MTLKYQIYARNLNMEREGVIADYQSAQFKLRFLDVGTWEIVVDRTRPEAVWLSTPGWGIEVVLNIDDTTQVPLISGPIHSRKHAKATDSNTLTATGYSDEVYLKWRLAHPSPAESFPPYNLQADDVRTGVASTVIRAYVNVNLGPGAIAPRRVPGLTIGTDPVVGASITGRARWNPLLPFLQDLAESGGIGFNVTMVAGVPVFNTYAVTDHSTDVILSEALGNLQSWDYSSESPETTYVFVGGQGDGTARTFVDFPDPDPMITWGRREALVDKTDTTDTTELHQGGTDYLVQHAEKAGLSITPVDTASCVYGRDYALGDRITVQLEGPAAPVTEIVREVGINLTPGGPQTMTPVIGTPSAPLIYRLFRTYRETMRRLSNLERR